MRVTTRAASRLVLMFPGQGAQRPGMGQSLAQNFPSAALVFAEVDDALSSHLSRTMFSGTPAELAHTAVTQPALLAHSVAALRVLEAEAGVRASAAACVMGHSVGEYAALVAAGALQLRDAARLLRLRGSAMHAAAEAEAAHGGVRAAMGMTALLFAGVNAAAGNSMGDEGAMPQLLLQWVSAACAAAVRAPRGTAPTPTLTVGVAAVNSPQQLVISGHTLAMDAVVALLRDEVAAEGLFAACAEQGTRILRPPKLLRSVTLTVGAPFHCPLMAPAATQLRIALGGGGEALAQQVIGPASVTDTAAAAAAPRVMGPPSIPLVANVTGTRVMDPILMCDSLVRGVTAPVLWARGVAAAMHDGSGGDDSTTPTFLELGTGAALCGLVRQCVGAKAATAAVGDAASVRSFCDSWK